MKKKEKEKKRKKRRERKQNRSRKTAKELQSKEVQSESRYVCARSRLSNQIPNQSQTSAKTTVAKTTTTKKKLAHKTSAVLLSKENTAGRVTTRERKGSGHTLSHRRRLAQNR